MKSILCVIEYLLKIDLFRVMDNIKNLKLNKLTKKID